MYVLRWELPSRWCRDRKSISPRASCLYRFLQGLQLSSGGPSKRSRKKVNCGAGGPLRVAAEATGSSLPKQSARHSPCPTPVGEESYGEKAGAALVRSGKQECFCSTLFFRPCLQHMVMKDLIPTHRQVTVREWGWKKKSLREMQEEKKRWQEPWLLSIKNQNKIST